MAHCKHAIADTQSRLDMMIRPELVEQAAKESKYTYRSRKLGPLETIQLWVMMILQDNGSLKKARLCAVGKCNGTFTSAALCKARQKLPLPLLQLVNKMLIELELRREPRILLVDCVNHYLADTVELRRRYRFPGQKKKKNRAVDFPQIRLLSICDLRTGLMLGRYAFASDKHESPMLKHVLDVARRGDTVVFDRGFISFANFHLLISKGIHFIGRLPKNLFANNHGRRRFIHPGRRGSGQVIWDKPIHRSKGLSLRRWGRLPDQMPLRQVMVKVKGGRSRGEIALITDLADTSAKQICEWYRRRWEIETNFRHMKQTLNLEHFKGKSIKVVQREILIQMIAYNLVRMVMMRAARIKGTSCTQISFSDTVTLMLLSAEIYLGVLDLIPERRRSPRPRRIKNRGKNYRVFQNQPQPQRKVA